jgi:hypothetical protein
MNFNGLRRFQNVPLFVCTMNFTIANIHPLYIATLIKTEQGVTTPAFNAAVVGITFMVPMGWVHGTVQVEDNPLLRLAPPNLIYPRAK